MSSVTDHSDDETITLGEFLTGRGWRVTADGKRWTKDGVTVTASEAQYQTWAKWNDEQEATS